MLKWFEKIVWEGLVEDATQWGPMAPVSFVATPSQVRVVGGSASCLVSDSSRSFSFADSLQGEDAWECTFLEAACDETLLEKECWPKTRLRKQKGDQRSMTRGFPLSTLLPESPQHFRTKWMKCCRVSWPMVRFESQNNKRGRREMVSSHLPW